MGDTFREYVLTNRAGTLGYERTAAAVGSSHRTASRWRDQWYRLRPSPGSNWSIDGSDNGHYGASTASLFLDRGPDEPALIWYVEVPRSVVSGWSNPEATVANAFPIRHEALSRPAEPNDRELLVHGVHPERPRRIGPDRSASPAVLGPTETTVDVALVRTALESGFPERFADWFVAVSRRVIVGDREFERIQSWSLEMLEAEAMYTESVILERGPDGYACYQYMGADDMQRVYDAYYDAWSPVARVSEHLLRQLLEDPGSILAYPLGTDCVCLAHAVDPDRPRRVRECLEGADA